MARRDALARGLMDERGLDALVLFGNSGVNRHNNVNPFWLSQYLDMHHCYVVLPREGDATLFVGLVIHVPNAREVTDIPNVEWGGYDAGATVAAKLREVGARTVGLVGVNSTWGVGMPYAHFERLRDFETADITREFGGLRLVKSEEEIERLRGAAALSDLAILTLQREAKPGRTEQELVAIVEDAYRRRGAQVRITFLRSMPMDEPNGCLPSQNPTSRAIAKSDVILTEFSASLHGYSGQVHRPVFVQAEPTDEWQQLFDVAKQAYSRIAFGMRTGSTEGDAIRNASVIGQRGYRIYDDLIHAYGTDYTPPLVGRSCAGYWIPGAADPPPGRTIERNMAIVIQSNPITPDERMGIQLGALTVVRDDGAECLHDIPFEPLIAA
jgi:Xaa-Pro aminopeptidase